MVGFAQNNMKVLKQQNFAEFKIFLHTCLLSGELRDVDNIFIQITFYISQSCQHQLICLLHAEASSVEKM